MSLKDFSETVRPPIEQELKRVIGLVDDRHSQELRKMLAYHLGWEGEGAGEQARGKRIRPQIVLLGTSAAGKDWRDALQAAAAVELIHNFSLIHDDIEDQSDFRHGRKTVWALWGEAQAINAGDCMYSLAYRAILQSNNRPEYITRAVDMLSETCIALTEGQHLDMAYEKRDDLSLEAYWTMIGGKTASLLSCSAAIGATITGADEKIVATLKEFAWNLGLAFQVQDDWLGIWGDSALTGKSADSDLQSGKKSLPVLLGLQSSPEFRKKWIKRPFTNTEIADMAGLLKTAGIQIQLETETTRLTEKAKAALDRLDPENGAVSDLRVLADTLLKRKK
ncbi:MAG: polyprenyl synthetase family protein [Leptolinea sp.]|nr:polyprenyl synthetase family protein [Leptolinea sp.]